MKIIYKGEKWGEIEVSSQKSSFYFYAVCRRTDKIFRIWGLSDGKEPLLIGIPEPDGDKMTLKKRISKEYMKNCGYLSAPERYAAGETAEDISFDIKNTDKLDFIQKSCAFNPAQPFEFAEYFALCNIEGDRAVMYTDKKTGRPIKKTVRPSDKA